MGWNQAGSQRRPLRLRRSMVKAEGSRSHRRRHALPPREEASNATRLRRSRYRSLRKVRGGEVEQADGDVPGSSLLQARVHRSSSLHLLRSRLRPHPLERRAFRIGRRRVRKEGSVGSWIASRRTWTHAWMGEFSFLLLLRSSLLPTSPSEY